MLKIVYKILLFVAAFLALWLFFLQLDWMHILHVNEVKEGIEEKFGDLMWKQIEKQNGEIKDTLILAPIDSLLTNICTQNKLNRSQIKLHLVSMEQVNAFALPNNHIVVFSGLVKEAENKEAVAGVLAHEIAHLQLHHVMKKLVKELGLSVIMGATSGGNGSGAVILKSIKMLSSTAYDRSLEEEADLKAVNYLVQAGIHPEPFAGFLFNMGNKEGDIQSYTAWVSTHPNSKERAQAILTYFESLKDDSLHLLSANDSLWLQMQQKLKTKE